MTRDDCRTNGRDAEKQIFSIFLFHWFMARSLFGPVVIIWIFSRRRNRFWMDRCFHGHCITGTNEKWKFPYDLLALSISRHDFITLLARARTQIIHIMFVPPSLRSFHSNRWRFTAISSSLYPSTFLLHFVRINHILNHF